MIGKKGQEEIVGFVLIIVIVAVVFLIFLGIFLRQKPISASESIDVSQFLESSMEYTTSCVTSFYPDYRKLGELFKECLSKTKCLDERETCEVLNETFGKIIENSWQIGEDNPLKGYEFVSEYSPSGDSPKEIILSLSSGNCTGTLKGSSYITPAFPGNIESRLKICS